MAQKLPRLKAEEIVHILARDGFILISQRGSHQKWHKPGTGKQVIVPVHKGKELPTGTLESIIIGSNIPETEFK
jgi:predicted RNA binding protein YcfA (HicA-like mRNA interferase family)